MQKAPTPAHSVQASYITGMIHPEYRGSITVPSLRKYRGIATKQRKQIDGVEIEKKIIKVKNRTYFSPLKWFRINEAQSTKKVFDLYSVCMKTGAIL